MHTAVKKFTAQVISRRTIADNTTEISFDTTQSGFDFIAGQYVTITLPSLGSFAHVTPRDQFRDFSIASTPEERGIITIAFRNSSSPWKRALLEGVCNEAEIEGPKGIFTLPDSAAVRVVFIAGGIGITPFRSMIRHSIMTPPVRPITLLHCNTEEAQAPYFAELSEISSHYPSVVYVPIWGQLKEDHIGDVLKNLETPIHWYIAGPPGMTAAARTILRQKGITDDIIKTEEFSGCA